MNKTQNILSTGKKVNSAIDNASSYYQARALTNRASDLSALLDSMGQGIQTIQAATEGLTSATAFLEQATAVANQALASDFVAGGAGGETPAAFAMRAAATKTYDEYLAEGYQEVTASMSATEIQDLINTSGKVIFKEDVTLTEGLTVNANASIIGNGKTLTVNADGTAAITVKGKGVNAEIKGLKIEGNGTNTYGIKATESGTITIDSLDNVNSYYYRNEELFNGKEYTQAIYDQLSDAGSVSGTATEYAMNYKADGVADNDADFGKGQWYIGAIGEWTDLHGYDYANITSGISTSGAKTTDRTLDKINATLGVIDGATTLSSGYYWSSSESYSYGSWYLNPNNGNRLSHQKDYDHYVRCFQLLENCFTPSTHEKPQIGDIMYADKTWSSAADYDANKAAGKTAVGVVFDVDTINGDVKIVALNDAHTSTVQMDPTYTDITNVPNYNSTTDLKNTGKIIVTHEESAGGAANGSLKEQYGTIMNEFNTLIKDSSYQGVNLLKGADLTVTFNESRSNKFTVTGRDMSAENLGLITRDWASKTDVETSIKELTEAIDAIREFQTELGNNYSIIQTRQNFTEALCDVLETGADNLVLADMNEESANYLALQTRQQLATNSLSLAAQSAQSVLWLF